MYRKSTIFFKERHLLLKAVNFQKIHNFLQRTLCCNNTLKTGNPRRKKDICSWNYLCAENPRIFFIKKHFLFKNWTFRKSTIFCFREIYLLFSKSYILITRVICTKSTVFLRETLNSMSNKAEKQQLSQRKKFCSQSHKLKNVQEFLQRKTKSYGPWLSLREQHLTVDTKKCWITYILSHLDVSELKPLTDHLSSGIQQPMSSQAPLAHLCITL